MASIGSSSWNPFARKLPLMAQLLSRTYSSADSNATPSTLPSPTSTTINSNETASSVATSTLSINTTTSSAAGVGGHASLTLPTPTSSPSTRFGYSVIRLTNVRIVRDGRLVNDDLWMTQHGKIIDPRQRFWHASEAREYAADVVIDCNGLIAAPGYIDLQLNGAFGVDFSSSDINREGIDKIRSGLLSQGVTSFVATIITSSPDTYRQVIPKIRSQNGDHKGASLLGLHLEGPFISVLGAHPGPLTRVPQHGMADVYDTYGPSDSLDEVKIVTLAPELKGAAECVSGLRSRGVVVSAGHTRSSFLQAQQAVDAGCTLITHLFNAMQAFHHRDPGLVGLIGTNDRQIFYSIIVDDIHTHPASVKIAYRSHPKGAVLVTDAMQAMGLDDGRYTFGSLQIDIKGATAKIVGSDTLAGSVARMDSCVRNFHRFTSCSIVEAVEAASLHPAQCLQMPNKGHLNIGGDADVILLDDSLNVRATFVGGELGWCSDRSAMNIIIGNDRLVGAHNLYNAPIIHTLPPSLPSSSSLSSLSLSSIAVATSPAATQSSPAAPAVDRSQ